MSDVERLAQIRERLENSTPEPWEDGACNDGWRSPIHCCVTGFRKSEDGDDKQEEVVIAEAEGDAPQDSQDMEFIANARTDVKWLCDKLVETTSEVERLKESLCREHQHTMCSVCGKDKHTPLRRDEMGGYVCMTCIDKRLDELDVEVERTRELFAEFGITDTDVLKHTLEDHKRWSKAIVSTHVRAETAESEVDRLTRERDALDLSRQIKAEEAEHNQHRYETAESATTAQQRIAELEIAIKLRIGRETNVPWNEVPDAEVEAWCQAAALAAARALLGKEER